MFLNLRKNLEYNQKGAICMQKFLNNFFNFFSKVTILIFIFASIYITAYFGFTKTCLKMIDIWGMLADGFLCSVFYIPLYLKNEMSKKNFIIFQIIYFFIITSITMFFGYKLGWYVVRIKSTVVWMIVMILIIYCLLLASAFKYDLMQANLMNEKLKSRKYL